MQYAELIANQRNFFLSHQTLSLSFRIEQLKKLKSLIKQYESQIVQALYQDLHKAPLEAEMNEILLVIKEIDYCIKHLKQWMKPKKVPTPLILWPGRSEIHYDPYGIVLIMGPWNYPFLLIMSPLIGAICAGNCAIVKPSELASHTQQIILKIINDHFSPKFIYAIEAEAHQSEELLKEKFDYICFTGGTRIGKLVMQAAAKHLTPLTLELGGKNPCIIDETADIDFAVQRVAWAKTTNAGQVCLAPDFIVIHESLKDAFIEKLKTVIVQFYGENIEASENYGRIINKNHFLRLKRLLQDGKILFGGQTNEETLFIAPTLIDQISWQDPIMQEEIFGPLLPIITFTDFENLLQILKSQPKSLALYLFTNNKMNENKVLNQISFGGGCINDCLVHIANFNMPFGGVGDSGMGSYHGKYSFATFSHKKSIYRKTWLVDTKLEYPPFSAKKLWWIRKLFQI